jgi:hypothetical protein
MQVSCGRLRQTPARASGSRLSLNWAISGRAVIDVEDRQTLVEYLVDDDLRERADHEFARIVEVQDVHETA